MRRENILLAVDLFSRIASISFHHLRDIRDKICTQRKRDKGGEKEIDLFVTITDNPINNPNLFQIEIIHRRRVYNIIQQNTRNKYFNKLNL